jgi:hypothetical protein
MAFGNLPQQKDLGAFSPLPGHLHPVSGYQLIPELVMVHDGDY